MKAAGAPESEIAKLRANALDQLIEGRLLARVVKQSDLHASDADVDETIAGIAKENGLTVEQLKASVTSHDIAYADYREQIRQELERRKVVQTMIASRVRVDEEDLKRLFAEKYAKQPAGGETVHVRQILIVFGPEAGRDQKQACQRRRRSAGAHQGGHGLRGRREGSLRGGAAGRRRHRLDPQRQHGAVDEGSPRAALGGRRDATCSICPSAAA